MTRQVVPAIAAAIGITLGMRVPTSAQRHEVAALDVARYDRVLDDYVRDGFVSYRALKASRQPLDAHVRTLADADVSGLSAPAEEAFWINAYNAIVLKTVIDHYPIEKRTDAYPPRSIRQIPGVFGQPHTVAGRTLSLDQIEQNVLGAFHDPRIYFALGRGAWGSGRLRSEAYAPDRLEAQLAQAAAECADHLQCLQVTPGRNAMRVSAIFSWRRQDFIDAYAPRLEGFPNRPPIERAVLAFVAPHLVDAERDFLLGDRFRVEYLPFDWSLNDLTNHRKGV